MSSSKEAASCSHCGNSSLNELDPRAGIDWIRKETKDNKDVFSCGVRHLVSPLHFQRLIYILFSSMGGYTLRLSFSLVVELRQLPELDSEFWRQFLKTLSMIDRAGGSYTLEFDEADLFSKFLSRARENQTELNNCLFLGVPPDSYRSGIIKHIQKVFPARHGSYLVVCEEKTVSAEILAGWDKEFGSE